MAKMVSALDLFNSWWPGCDALARLEANDTQCLVNNLRGTRCGHKRWRKNLSFSEAKNILRKLERLDSEIDRKASKTLLSQLTDSHVCPQCHRAPVHARIGNAFSASEQAQQPGISLTPSVADDKTDTFVQSLRKTELKRKSPKAGAGASTQDISCNLVPSTENDGSYIPVFEPYQPIWQRRYSPAELLREVVTSPLKDSEHQIGKIYVYRSSEDCRYRKIGRTKKEARVRLGEWERKCGHTPQLVYATATNIKHYVRLEKLVHAELKELRYREPCCRGCGGTHVEWFYVSDEQVTAVVEKWSQFLETNPYAMVDEQWQLKPSYHKHLKTLCTPSAFVQQGDLDFMRTKELSPAPKAGPRRHTGSPAPKATNSRLFEGVNTGFPPPRSPSVTSIDAELRAAPDAFSSTRKIIRNENAGRGRENIENKQAGHRDVEPDTPTKPRPAVASERPLHSDDCSFVEIGVPLPKNLPSARMMVAEGCNGEMLQKHEIPCKVRVRIKA